MPQMDSPSRTAGVPPAPTPSAPDHAGWHSRGYLPHLDAPNAIQHIVFRLNDSLPSGLFAKIGTTAHDRMRTVDAVLDEGRGRRDLATPRIACLVQSALLAFDGERYRMLGWCVMPNHVHSLVETVPGYQFDRIVHSWKSYTAKKANRLLGRTGPFWAPEYFDRFMRDEQHLATTAAYVEGNPVKAGLCENVEDWPFSSAWHAWGGRDARGPRSCGRPAKALIGLP